MNLSVSSPLVCPHCKDTYPVQSVKVCQGHEEVSYLVGNLKRALEIYARLEPETRNVPLHLKKIEVIRDGTWVKLISFHHDNDKECQNYVIVEKPVHSHSA